MATYILPGVLATPVAPLPYQSQTLFTGENGPSPSPSSWGTTLGSFSISGGALNLPAASGSTPAIVYNNTNISVATWTYRAAFGALNGAIGLRFICDTNVQLPANMLSLAPVSTGTLYLFKYVSSTATALITASVTIDTNPHTYTVTRDGSGNFEIFMDGTSYGTATDTFLPTVSYIQIYTTSDVAGEFYSLEVGP